MKFRIKRDDGFGYEVQIRWFGFYRQLDENELGKFGKNTWTSVEAAEKFIERYCFHKLREKQKQKKIGEVVKKIEITDEDLVQWKLQGKDEES